MQTGSEPGAPSRPAEREGPVLYMIIEHYRNGGPALVYARFRAQGRGAAEGLRYVNSWVTEDLAHCYQVTERDDRALLEAWMT